VNKLIEMLECPKEQDSEKCKGVVDINAFSIQESFG